MIRKLLLTAAVLPLTACSATDLATSTQRLRQANQAAQVASGVASTVAPKDTEAVPEAVSLADAEPITGEAFDVTLKRVRGKAKAVTAKPRIAVVGYNVGAITKSRAVASTRGGFTRNSAKTSMTLLLAGIDDAVLQDVADEAYSDLVSRLTAAGFDVVGAEEMQSAPGIENILPGEAAYDGNLQRGNGNGRIRVAGPHALGASDYNALGRTTFNGNKMAKAGGALDAALLFPNLSLGFAQTESSGNAMFARKARVEGGAMFHVDPATKIDLVYSKKGRYADGWASWQTKDWAGTDAAFAEVAKTDSSNNALAVGLSKALGAGMGSNSKSEYTVVADPVRYKALALRAAKGVNTALVAEMLAARSGS